MLCRAVARLECTGTREVIPRITSGLRISRSRARLTRQCLGAYACPAFYEEEDVGWRGRSLMPTGLRFQDTQSKILVPADKPKVLFVVG